MSSNAPQIHPPPGMFERSEYLDDVGLVKLNADGSVAKYALMPEDYEYDDLVFDQFFNVSGLASTHPIRGLGCGFWDLHGKQLKDACENESDLRYAPLRAPYHYYGVDPALGAFVYPLEYVLQLTTMDGVETMSIAGFKRALTAKLNSAFDTYAVEAVPPQVKDKLPNRVIVL